MNTSIAPVGPTLLDKARDGVEGAGWVIQQLRGSIQEMRRAAGKAALGSDRLGSGQANQG